MEDCPRYDECANADLKCHLCVNFNCFKTGRSRGKGADHEKRILKKSQTRSRAHLRAGSGAAAHAKGDVIDEQFLYEGKSGYAQVNGKGRKSMTIQRGWLLKIESEALAEGKVPALVIHFDGAPDDELWAITRLETLHDSLESRRE